jgi:hypothetical protein
MKLLDANILLYAYDKSATHHETCRTWLESVFNAAEQLTSGAFRGSSWSIQHSRQTRQPVRWSLSSGTRRPDCHFRSLLTLSRAAPEYAGLIRMLDSSGTTTEGTSADQAATNLDIAYNFTKAIRLDVGAVNLFKRRVWHPHRRRARSPGRRSTARPGSLAPLRQKRSAAERTLRDLKF